MRIDCEPSSGQMPHDCAEDASDRPSREMTVEEKIERIKAEATLRARTVLEEREGRLRQNARVGAASSDEALQPVRAINEDDDGYDPYSDFHDRRVEEALFQRNPWE